MNAMPAPLLTIAIPTYNRAMHLAVLLEVLSKELAGHANNIEVLIFDNASTDDTPSVIARFKDSYPACRVVRHHQNIGSAPNFQACFHAATAQYFWMMGDDDAPVIGLIERVMGLLRQESPDMVYMGSHWVPDITSLAAKWRVMGRPTSMLDRTAFSRRTYVWLSFISSVIIDRSRLLARTNISDLFGCMGAYFVQLSWTLSALKTGERFAVIEGPCILATQGNSGGYGAITVFGTHFPKAVRTVLGRSQESDILVRRTFISYLPPLIWAIRQARASAFDTEDPWPRLRAELGASPWFWAVLLPLGRLPSPLAAVVYQLWRVINRVVTGFDRLRARGLVSRRVGQ